MIVALAGSTAAGPGCFAATHPARRVAGFEQEDEAVQERSQQCEGENPRRHRTDSSAEKS
jgi:hypothetical protein